ncbi:MAG: hypothetical protein CMN85_10945 [Spongiibacteraceae bacterium]|nr:hypothetical protein [Spongiibacteraceae bacterium]|tara:strand:- start:13106 stop:13477 length:372 start_codon:yes stop_codon:yes gene_type:complete
MEILLLLLAAGVRSNDVGIWIQLLAAPIKLLSHDGFNAALMSDVEYDARDSHKQSNKPNDGADDLMIRADPSPNTRGNRDTTTSFLRHVCDLFRRLLHVQAHIYSTRFAHKKTRLSGRALLSR